MRKKNIFLALLLAVVMLVAFAGVASADDPTTVDVTWDDGSGGYGSGVVETTFTAGGDAVVSFQTGGNGIRGAFTATDTNYAPYYGFDNVNSQIKAEVQNGGYIWNKYEYTDGYPGCGYGPAGQWAYGIVSTTGLNSYGALALRHNSNYADMDSYNYGWYTPDQPSYGHQFTALNAEAYYMERSVYGGTGPDSDWATVQASGTGDAELGCAYAMNLRVNNLTLGWNGTGGAYDYTAKFEATGTGIFTTEGLGNESVTFERMGASATGDGSAGSANLAFIANWLNGSVIVENYGITVK